MSDHPHHHHHHHDRDHHPQAFPGPSDQACWDEKYRGRTAAWDPDPNPWLPEVVAGLKPGTALDAGCGEGSDAVWLAGQGWRVTGVDLSEVALDRGRAADPQGRVTWVQADVLSWTPPAGAFDLVSMHFFHAPPAERKALFQRLARAVAPGGTLLIVAHHPSDLQRDIGRPPLPELFYTAEEVAEAVEGLTPVVVGTKARQVTGRGGQPIEIEDTYFLARASR